MGEHPWKVPPVVAPATGQPGIDPWTPQETANAVTVLHAAPVGSAVIAVHRPETGPGPLIWNGDLQLETIEFGIAGPTGTGSFGFRLQVSAPGGGAWLRVISPAGWGSTVATVVAGQAAINVWFGDFKPFAVGVYSLSWRLESRTATSTDWQHVRHLSARVFVVPKHPSPPWAPTAVSTDGLIVVQPDNVDASLLEFAASSLRTSPGWSHPARQLALALAGPATKARPLRYNLQKVEAKPVAGGGWDAGGPLVWPMNVDNSGPIPKLRLRLPPARSLVQSWISNSGSGEPLEVQSVDCATLLTALAAAIGTSLRVIRLGHAIATAPRIQLPWESPPFGPGVTGTACDWMIPCRPFLPLGHDTLWLAQPQSTCDGDGSPHLRTHFVALEANKDLVFDVAIAAMDLPMIGSEGKETVAMAAPAGVARPVFAAALLKPGLQDPTIDWFPLPDLELDLT